MFVGLRTAIIAGLVLVAILTGWQLIRYIRDSGEAGLKIEQLEDQLQVRERIDEAIRTTPTSVDDAIRLLERRQNTRH